MRKKLFTHRSERGKWAAPKNSNIRRYFGPLIDFLLAPYPILPGESNGLETTYISNPAIENELSEILSHDQSNFWQLVGYKGTGKTTAIRGGLRLWNSSSITRLVQETLIVYCSLNSTDLHSDDSEAKPADSVRLVVEGAIGAALDIVQSAQASRCGTKVTDHEFYDFLQRTKADVLFRYPITVNDNDPKIARLRSWEAANRLTYRAVQLKFELSRLPKSARPEATATPFGKRQIVVIFDDIEGLPNKEARKALTMLISPLWNCLRNGVDYPTKILIAHRPHTRDEFMRNQTWTPITIEFVNALTLRTLLETRAEKFLEHTEAGRDLKSRHTWQESYAALWSLLTKYGTSESQEVILALSNQCFRDSLGRLTNLVQHASTDRPQLGQTEGGGFSLSNISKLPQIPRANLIELIGMRGYQAFSTDEKIGIVNLFENSTDDADSDFLVMLLVHWAWLHTEQYAQNWPRLVDTHTLESHLNRALPGHPLLGRTRWSVDRAEALGLLDDVLDQDDPSRVLHHLMPRADVLYQEMAHSSAILELGLQEFFMEEAELSNFQSDRRGTFMLACRFCMRIVEFERSLLSSCVDKKLLWDGIFHRKLISRQALTGLEKTWSRWSGDKPVGGSVELASLNKAIGKLEYDYAH